MYGKLRWVVLAAFVLAMTAGVVADDDPLAKTGEDFGNVVGKVDEGIQTVDNIREALWQAQEYYRYSPDLSDQEKAQILEQIAAARDDLDNFAEPLRQFSQMAAPVSSAFDVYAQVKELRDAMKKTRSRQGGPLGGKLQVLATIMQQAGGQVPLIGAALETYGKITEGLLDATDHVAKTIDENRNQGRIGGPGYYATGANVDKYNKMVEQFGEDFAQTYHYYPIGPMWIFKAEWASDAPTMIWDKSSKSWYQVDGSAPVDRIHRMNLLAGKSRTPWEMKVLVEHWDSAQDRIRTAGGVATAWEKLYDAKLWDYQLDAAFSDVDSKYDMALSWWQDHQEGFTARYTYDSDFKRNMNSAMRDLYKALMDEGPTNAAEYIKEMGEKYGFPVPTDYQPGDEPEEDGQPDTPPDQPTLPDQPSSDTPSGQVVNSICFLVDCSGSMRGSKIDAAREAVKSSVASTADGKTEWALLGFGACNTWQVCGFTTNPDDITSSVGGLAATGDTPLNFSIYIALKYLTENGSGINGKLIILCDGQDNCDERGSNSHPDAMANIMKMVRETGLG